MILDIAPQTEQFAALAEMRGLLVESCEAESNVGNIVRICHIIGELPDADERQKIVEQTERLFEIVSRMREVAKSL
jgi:Asp-tRNA(Asn)/Glu-tRNA(Gln) amidotransferase C subunit